MKYIKHFTLELIAILFLAVFYIIQLPFTPFVKLLTGKWIMNHIDKALEVDEG